MPSANFHHLGVDVGGTFTDLALLNVETGFFSVEKVLTSPADPSLAILAGSESILATQQLRFGNVSGMVHATTLVANTLIQRVGARIALIANDGFLDVLTVGTESRYDLYDLNIERPEPVVPRRLRFGISERTDSSGALLKPVDENEIVEIVEQLIAHKVEAVAVCLLHSYRNPTSELAVADHLRRHLPRLPVSLSAEVCPEVREYPRASTVAANAYVQPLVRGYLSRLNSALEQRGLERPLFLMLSEGGISTVETASAAPIRLVESGPAAGAVAAAAVADATGYKDVLAFDMGGTTAKLCLIVGGTPAVSHGIEVARLARFKRGSGLPLQIPAVEMIEIGAGGGSVATVDREGLLQVGPLSAGASPGPACYGLGGEVPTVTDADLVLGYLDAGAFLGGRMQLNAEAAAAVIQGKVAAPAGITLLEAAAGIHEIVCNSMANAARVHVIEQGGDPRNFTMVAFGGAGPVHAWRVGQLLKIARIVVPPAAGVMSALGLLIARPSIQLSRSQFSKLDRVDWSAAAGIVEVLSARATKTLRSAGIAEADITVTLAADCRYSGQAYEITVGLDVAKALDQAALAAAFESEYGQRFGRTMASGAIELVTWRVTASGPPSRVRPRARRPATVKPDRRRRVYFHGEGWVQARVTSRYALEPGTELSGPVLIEEDETTSVVGVAGRVFIDAERNLIIESGLAR